MLHHTHLSFKEPLEYREETYHIVLHHSEVTSRHTVEDIHRWHQNKGWAGIGYHFFIDKDGEIYEGRPLDTVGAHAYGHNKMSIGICFEGDFNKEEMNDEQVDASIMLLAILSLAYPESAIDAHKDLTNKDCPGKNFPMERIYENVGLCKMFLKALFGEQVELMMVSNEWRHAHDGMGDEAEEERRHNAPDWFETGNFNYQRFLDLLAEVEEEDWHRLCRE